MIESRAAANCFDLKTFCSCIYHVSSRASSVTSGLVTRVTLTLEPRARHEGEPVSESTFVS